MCKGSTANFLGIINKHSDTLQRKGAREEVSDNIIKSKHPQELQIMCKQTCFDMQKLGKRVPKNTKTEKKKKFK